MITRHEFHSGCFVSMRSVACKILYKVISNDKVNVASSISQSKMLSDSARFWLSRNSNRRELFLFFFFEFVSNTV